MTAGPGTDRGSPGAAIVLAAGASRRFRTGVKATALVEGEPAVRRVVRLALEGGFRPVVVVLGAHGPVVARAVADQPVRLVEHDGWEQGRSGSVQAGLSAVGDPPAVLLWPIDHPFAGALSLQALRRAMERDELGAWFVPTFEGRGGHPVLLRAATFGPIRSLGADVPLRSLLPRFGPQVVRVSVPDPGVVANVDTAEEFDRALADRSGGRWTDA
ncbi:MAG TPA: nucleotidyltransferase family protein [Thermoplasmata archaeon]|nr:nucleotidyltransferase family protein [Thermoplasmata archaeon]